MCPFGISTEKFIGEVHHAYTMELVLRNTMDEVSALLKSVLWRLQKKVRYYLGQTTKHMYVLAIKNDRISKSLSTCGGHSKVSISLIKT